MKKQRIHIICPVRNISEDNQKEIDNYCKWNKH